MIECRGKHICEEENGGHETPIQRVNVCGFGEPYKDWYCQYAIRRDRERGFNIVVPLQSEW